MRDQALGEHLAVGAGDLDGVAGVEVALHARRRRPAAATCPARSSARRAPSSTTTVPVGADGEGDPQLAGRQPPVAGLARRCRRPASPATASASTPARSAAAITARTPDHAAILAAASFDAMPAAAPDGAGAAGDGLELGSTSTISSMSEARGVEAGIGGEQAGRVGEQHQQVGADEVGDEGGDAVVVAEADLVVGDGVVLVDDRHARRARAGGSSVRAGVQVLAAAR